MTTSFQQGISAHRSGVKFEECPFAPDEQLKYSNWRSGWLSEDHMRRTHPDTPQADVIE